MLYLSCATAVHLQHSIPTVAQCLFLPHLLASVFGHLHGACCSVAVCSLCVNMFGDSLCVNVFGDGLCVNVFGDSLCVNVFGDSLCVNVFGEFVRERVW